ncbi:protein RER1 isoform X2 [Adelges cooleyi]|uniref:protein RER1 isoform X2 n=1 Tax=Adelges cooleyi TaxID=133065 RepID=UPI00217F6640|nr:protein RER1 isoform X2 [Adelges cooleyi]
MQDFTNDSSSQRGTVSLAYLRLSQRIQKFLDDITPYRTPRWVAALGIIVLFMLRIVLCQGWYIVTYALGIYHLNLFIAFLTPKIDPAMEEFDDDSGPSLPTHANEEFRPFIRRLPEFKFWYSIMKSTIISIIATFFQFTDVPVFWPILVLYFIVLFCITMKRQIMHMIRYRYLPFTHSKPKYQGHDDSGKVIRAK